MIAEFIITFREALEAGLIVGIVLAYLERTKNTGFNKHVYLGILSGIVGSIIVAALFQNIMGGFEGKAEELFEGTLMLFAAVMITWMILWMLKQKHIREEIESKVELELSEKHALGLMLFTFISVLREGVETVIFLGAVAISAGAASLLGAIGGIVAAVILVFLLFETVIKVNIKLFFNVTSVILILFAAGIFAHGVHEYQEAGILEEQQELWNTKNILDDKSTFGSVVRSLFGYNDNPTLYEVIAYFGYIVAIFVLYLNIERVHKII